MIDRSPTYRGTSLIRNSADLGPYRKAMPRSLHCMVVRGRWAVSYEQGTPVAATVASEKRSISGLIRLSETTLTRNQAFWEIDFVEH